MNAVYISVWLAVGKAAMNKKGWQSMEPRRWSVTDPSSLTGHEETSMD
jgi:hypothetical protein